MSKLTPHGANKGDHISAHGRDLITKIRRAKGEGEPVYRKFDGRLFRLQTIQPSIREANEWIEKYKQDYFVRKVRGPKGFYVIYVRRKTDRRGQ